MAVPSVGFTESITLGESLSRAKITKMKTIFSPCENQHPSVPAPARTRLTSDRTNRRIHRRRAAMPRGRTWRDAATRWCDPVIQDNSRPDDRVNQAVAGLMFERHAGIDRARVSCQSVSCK
ncbi:hypothetical protein [Mycobacterium sp. 852002-10029_SCH5224772]|uniref:hypothetical protein n=1 Tax=Mycobacterium sp. 852002-10029_SCH5224772 TaxID=1834083 RepID=UPI0012E953AD|nr:hypothetical protein [Mycobacterium sp. 852002-10029_SCH5224772]